MRSGAARRQYRLAVQRRTLTSLRREQLVSQRIVNHPGDQGSVLARFRPCRPVLQPHRNAELGKAVGEVGCAVQRVHIPPVFGFETLARALFAVHAVARKNLGQSRANELFAGAVGHGHKVHVALVFRFHAAGKIVAQQRARLARDSCRFGNEYVAGFDRRFSRSLHRPASPAP